MDFYTKIVLTVIAGALSVIALQNFGAIPARAQAPAPGVSKVALCDITHASRCVGITDDGKLTVLSSPGN